MDDLRAGPVYDPLITQYLGDTHLWGGENFDDAAPSRIPSDSSCLLQVLVW